MPFLPPCCTSYWAKLRSMKSLTSAMAAALKRASSPARQPGSGGAVARCARRGWRCARTAARWRGSPACWCGQRAPPSLGAVDADVTLQGAGANLVSAGALVGLARCGLQLGAGLAAGISSSRRGFRRNTIFAY